MTLTALKRTMPAADALREALRLIGQASTLLEDYRLNMPDGGSRPNEWEKVADASLSDAFTHVQALEADAAEFALQVAYVKEAVSAAGWLRFEQEARYA